MIFEGIAWKYGRDVDTDAIIPARYLTTENPQELARYCMEDIDPTFATKVAPGDIMVAEENFGCGSSREHAPLALKGAGVSAVIAKSFARIFYRNAINIGLPIIEAPEAVDGISKRDLVRIDTEAGTIENLTTGKSWTIAPFPEFVQRIIESGGLVEYTKARLTG